MNAEEAQEMIEVVEENIKRLKEKIAEQEKVVKKWKMAFPVCPWCKQRYAYDELIMSKSELLCPKGHVLGKYKEN